MGGYQGMNQGKVEPKKNSMREAFSVAMKLFCAKAVEIVVRIYACAKTLRIVTFLKSQLYCM